MGHSAKFSITDEEGNFTNMNDLQHSTMYLSFILASLFDLLINPSSIIWGIDGLCYSVAYGGEAFLFYFHLGGRPMVDTQIHLCLVTSCVMCAVTSVLARWKSCNPIISIAWSVSNMVQGSWFCHAGLILYPLGQDEPSIDLNDMEAMMYVTNLFIIHILFAMVLVLLLYIFIKATSPPPKVQKHYIKHSKPDIGNVVYKTVPSNAFYVDSD